MKEERDYDSEGNAIEDMDYDFGDYICRGESCSHYSRRLRLSWTKYVSFCRCYVILWIMAHFILRFVFSSFLQPSMLSLLRLIIRSPVLAIFCSLSNKYSTNWASAHEEWTCFFSTFPLFLRNAFPNFPLSSPSQPLILSPTVWPDSPTITYL